MKLSRSFRLIFVSLIALTSVFAQNDDEQLVCEIVKHFYNAYQAKDETKLKQFWKSDSPHYAVFQKETAQFFTASQSIWAKQPEFINANFKDEVFRLRIKLNLNGNEQKLTFLFVKENGEWAIWRIRPSEEDFSFQIANADNPTERQILLENNRDLFTVALCNPALEEATNFRNRGEFAKANNVLDVTEDLAKRLDAKLCLARSLHRRGTVKFGQGDYREATKVLFQSLEIAQNLNDLGLQADVYLNLGLTVILQGNVALCQEYYEKSLAIAEKLGDKRRMARVLNNLANISGDPKISIPMYERIIKLAEESNNPQIVAYAIGNMGWAYSHLGNYDKAIEYMQQARERLEKLDAQYDLIEAFGALSEFYIKKGNYEEALIWAENGYQQSVKLGAIRDNDTRVFTSKAKILVKLGRFEEAKKTIEEAVSLVENARQKVLSSEYTQARFMAARHQTYENWYLILNEMGEKENSLTASEIYKARVLWDVMRTGKTSPSKAMNDEEREKERQLRQNLTDLNREYALANQKEVKNPQRIGELENKLKQARLALEAFQFQLYGTKPDLKVQRGEFEPIRLNEIQKLFPNEQTAFAEFAVTDEKTLLYVITLQNNRPRLEIYPINIKREDLRKQVGEFLAVVSEKKINLDYKEKGQSLYKLLLDPAREQLKGITSLVFIPDSFLWELPFQTLMPAQNRFLIEYFTISYCPSLTVLREMQRNQSQIKRNPKLLAFGNPALNLSALALLEKTRGEKLKPIPSAKKEVEMLAKLYGAKQSAIYTNYLATETIFKTNSKGFNILHFATHGILNNQFPMYSALVLSLANDSNEDGLLEAWELMSMNLNADLAVLSACESGRGEASLGEGMVGLSWAFFIAGTPRIVASQWKVDSISTTELMTEFHRNLRLFPNNPVAKSLQMAMLKQIKKQSFRHPFYWAGFVSIGKN
jgi:CHAT domain-containing protein